ncbi:hypothetical protein C8R43DRAFT_227057 [Mycena crocata]|nr:hypothetical protein C8R43DRAFT_227057 [Mycena crocata]
MTHLVLLRTKNSVVLSPPLIYSPVTHHQSLEFCSRYLQRLPDGERMVVVDVETYFFDDGDCIFLVEGVLFKLHKWSLSRDPDSMFRGMFNIPQGSLQTTLDPIPLSGDSADEFRALCWAVYALPNEIHLQMTRDADVTRLINVATMCHKYTLPVFENWALDMLCIQCQAPLDHLATCPQDVLDRIMALGAKCNHDHLLGLVEVTWISRIKSGALQGSDALVSGERHGRRRFLGEVYYQLNKQIHLDSATLTPTRGFSHLNLTDKQLLRLLSGHVLLSAFWKQLSQSAIKPRVGGCNTHNSCAELWKEVPWDPSDGSDVLAALLKARNFLLWDPVIGRPRPAPFYVSASCIAEHINGFHASVFAGGIAPYFLGPDS